MDAELFSAHAINKSSVETQMELKWQMVKISLKNLKLVLK